MMKRICVFLLLGVLLFSIALSGCSQKEETTEATDAAYPYTFNQLMNMCGSDVSDIQSISILRRPFDSVMDRYKKEREVQQLIHSLDQGYTQISESDFLSYIDTDPINLGSMFLDCGSKQISVYILPCQKTVIECEGLYYISEDTVVTLILKNEA